MTEESPPSFSASVEASEASLPPEYNGPGIPASQSTPRPLTERVYTLETSKKQPWAFLKVNSRGGKVTSIPSFVQGEPITGTVELSLEKTEHIQAVTIEVRGETLAVGQESIPFLAQEMTLWSTSMGTPGTANSGNGSPKLKGKYVWPFSISLPEKVTASSVAKGPEYEYPLPPSFSERASPSYLEYKIVVTFRRGRLRVDNSLSTSFAFLPRSQPEASSALRQLAYRENSPPPGPKRDPEGWDDLGAKSVIGTVFDSRKVEVTCSLSLAKPLCYSRGTSIPFALYLSCSDQQTLDLFAARGSLAIRLVRHLNVGPEATDEAKATRSDNTFITNVGRGTYWPSDNDNPQSDSRRLEGEIPVNGDLKPSFVFPRMVVKYHVLFSLTAPGFIATSEDEASIATYSREVVIATDLAPGPIPRSRVSASRSGESSGNYDISIGMLTGANQRFLHHHAWS